MKPTMHPDLIGYLVNGLDEPDRLRIEEQLRRDPALRAQLDILRRRIAPLESAREDDAPPLGLAARTLAFVDEQTRISLAPVPVSLKAPGVERSWWRRVDIAVAATVLLLVGGLVVPGTLHLRTLSVRTECQNQMRTMWTGMQAYQSQRKEWPEVHKTPRPVAGMVVPLMHQAGVLPHPSAGSCPGAESRSQPVALGLEAIAALSNEEFEAIAHKLLPGYSYSLGYRDDDGQLHGLTALGHALGGDAVPVFADTVANPLTPGNSANHAGQGQNVLHLGGTVTFKVHRVAGPSDNDMYLNRNHKVAAGVGKKDTVLGFSHAAP